MSNVGKELYEFGPFRLDPEKRVLFRGEEPVPLQLKAFETLLALVRRSEEVVLKDDLMKIVWPDTFVEESNLTQNIFVLRKVLGDQSSERRYIATIPGRGYRFVEKVRTIPREEILLVERHSRSKVTITEELKQGPAPSTLGRGELLALPGEVAGSRRWWWILAAAVVATAVLTLALYAVISPAPTLKVLRTTRLTHSGRISPQSAVLSDGTRLYFTETAGGSGVLAEVSVHGGDPMPILSSLPSTMLFDLDAGRSRLLVAQLFPGSIWPLWVLPAAGGSAQRLGELVGDSAAWSPDGQHIAYGREGSIYVAAGDGSQSRKLFSLHGFVEDVRWSPDGARLRFSVEEPADGGRSLWDVSADGSDPHQLSLGWQQYAHHWGEGEYPGDWTPDGKYFVFRAQRFGVESFWAIREKSSWWKRSDPLPVQIYTSPDHLGRPHFSPDGKKIFFIGYREQRELVRYDSARQLFVPYLGGIAARLLSFSPDAQWVAYKSDIDGTLWRSRVDGSEKLQLTFHPIAASHSSWSPDGKTIVFQGGPPGEATRLYTISVNGGTPQILQQEDQARLAQPSWCGDGSAILYMRWSKDVTGGKGSSVFRLDMKTHQAQMLEASDGFDGIHCSPDGKHAAAANQADRQLMLYDFATGKWSVLSDGAAYGWGIRWSSDSRYVYYQHADQEQEQPIFRVRIADRNVEQITSAKQILRADVLSYTMTGLTPDNSPVASIVRTNSDVYALDLDVP